MTQIPNHSGSRLLDSVAFLNEHYGLVLNGHITLNFEQLGVASEQAAKGALTDMNTRLARRLRAAGVATGSTVDHFYVYAHELCARYGWHVHELIAVPGGLLGNVKPWLDEWAGRKYGVNRAGHSAIVFRPLAGKSEEMRVALQAKLVRYILKTMAPGLARDRDGQPADVLDLIGLKRRQQSDHLQIKRMTGTSQNIAYRTQLAAGFQPPKHWEDLLSGKQLWSHRERRGYPELFEQLRDMDC